MSLVGETSGLMREFLKLQRGSASPSKTNIVGKEANVSI